MRSETLWEQEGTKKVGFFKLKDNMKLFQG